MRGTRNTAAAVFLPLEEHTVIVGGDTLRTTTVGWSAIRVTVVTQSSGARTASASGGGRSRGPDSSRHDRS